MLFQVSMAVLSVLAGVVLLTVAKNGFISFLGVVLLMFGGFQVVKLASVPPSTEPLIAMSSGTMFAIMGVATAVGIVLSLVYYIVSSNREKEISK